MSKVNVSRQSLARRLLIFLLIPVLLTILIAATIAIVVAQSSITTLYDKQLKNNAETLLALLHYEYAEESEDDDYDDEEEEEDKDSAVHELEEIVSEIESRQGLSVLYRVSIDSTTLFTSSRVINFPNCPVGYSDFTAKNINEDNVEWRCYNQTQSIATRDVPITIEFFEPLAQRHEAIISLIFRTFSPILFLPIVVMMTAWWGVQRGLNSLTLVSDAVRKRSVNNLEKISRSDQPVELLPIVDSVNELLKGIELGVIREKQFTDDAAHELRTPITSIKMIEQLIRRDSKDLTISDHLNNLKMSAEHCSSLIDQLLDLARLQTTQSLEKTRINLHQIIIHQLGLLSPHITSKSLAIDISSSLEGFSIEAHEASISLLINNLLTNAIKFSQNNGTVYIFSNEASLFIEDDGAGIRNIDRTRVFDRFYRAAEYRSIIGNGLGLALAKWVADSHDFTLTTNDPCKGTGASFELVCRTVVVV